MMIFNAKNVFTQNKQNGDKKKKFLKSRHMYIIHRRQHLGDHLIDILWNINSYKNFIVV